MLFGSRDAFIIGLVFISFSKSLKCEYFLGLSEDGSVPSAKDSGHIINSHKASVNDATDDVLLQHCNRTQKLMSITLSEEFINMRNEFTSNWNSYKAVRAWRKTNLTYSIHNYGGEPKADVNSGVKKSFGKWSAAAPRLKITQLRDGVQADMNIKFISNLKNDRGVELLGSTSLPHAGGNVNLNGSENWLFYSANSSPEDLAYGWSFGGYYGSSRPGFVCIATHEIGHALGLDHSQVTRAIMHKDYPCSGTRDVTLASDDINGIKALYPGGGSGNQSSGSVSTVRPPSPVANRGGYPGNRGNVPISRPPVANRGGYRGNYGNVSTVRPVANRGGYPGYRGTVPTVRPSILNRGGYPGYPGKRANYSIFRPAAVMEGGNPGDRGRDDSSSSNSSDSFESSDTRDGNDDDSSSTSSDSSDSADPEDSSDSS